MCPPCVRPCTPPPAGWQADRQHLDRGFPSPPLGLLFFSGSSCLASAAGGLPFSAMAG